MSVKSCHSDCELWLKLRVSLSFLTFCCLCDVNRPIVHRTRWKRSALVRFISVVFFFRNEHFSLFFSVVVVILLLHFGSFPRVYLFEWMSGFISIIFLIRRSILSFCSNNCRSVVILAFGHWQKILLKYLHLCPCAECRRPTVST